MTPTLWGRWQTRLFLLATFGILATLPFYGGYIGGHAGDIRYFWVVFYVGLFGLVWDLLYDYLQKFLWDHDWPGILQFFTGILEGVFLWLIIKLIGLPFLSSDGLEIGVFMQHYSLVWLAVYLSSWVVMRLLFPRWRFRGGEWFGKWPFNRS